MQIKVLFLAASLALHTVALPLARGTTSLDRRQDEDADEDAEDPDTPEAPANGGLVGGLIGDGTLGDVAEGLGEFSPIEDGQFEGDVDTGGESDHGGSSTGVANGLLGGGSGSNSHNADGSTSSSSQCSLTACTSGSSAANGNNTSTDTSSSGTTVVSGPLVSTNGPLVSLVKKAKTWLRL